MEKKEFNDEWVKKELSSLNEIPIGSLFLLQILISCLNFLSKNPIKNINDYKKVKRR